MRFAVALLAAYLIGSLNAAIIVLRLLGKADPRTVFSGNAGTTNVYRLAGGTWAAVVLLIEVFRGAVLAVLAMAFLPPVQVPWIGLALVAGSRFPCFHRFRGGKGVAGYLGFLLPLAPWAAAVSCLAWVLVHQGTGIPFVASFIMVLFLAGGEVGALGAQPAVIAGTAATVALIFLSHRGNVVALMRERRLKKGEKPALRWRAGGK
jgi:glycerol-3-phosphate acyltransferase PlsY